MLCCRDATERQIEMERARRNRIEAAKKAELDAERQKLTEWQRQMEGQAGASGSRPAGAGDGGDESDYEEEEEEEEEKAAAGAERQEAEKAMEDHPDYYGKGFKRWAVCLAGRT